MNVNNLYIGLCLALMVGSSPTWAASTTNKGANPNGKPFVELQGQIVEVEGEISTLQDQVDALVGRADSLEALQAALQDAVAKLEATNLTLEAQIAANATDVDALEVKIAALYATNDALQAQIDDLGDADDALQVQIDANAGAITTLALAIDTLAGDLQSTIDNNAELISIMQSQIVEVAAHLEEKQNRVDGLCPDGSAIQEILADGSVVCDIGGGDTTGIVQVETNQCITPPATSVYTSCPVGYVRTGCGGYTRYGLKFIKPRGVRDCEVRSTRNYDLNVCAYATCIRLQP